MAATEDLKHVTACDGTSGSTEDLSVLPPAGAPTWAYEFRRHPSCSGGFGSGPFPTKPGAAHTYELAYVFDDIADVVARANARSSNGTASPRVHCRFQPLAWTAFEAADLGCCACCSALLQTLLGAPPLPMLTVPEPLSSTPSIPHHTPRTLHYECSAQVPPRLGGPLPGSRHLVALGSFREEPPLQPWRLAPVCSSA